MDEKMGYSDIQEIRVPQTSAKIVVTSIVSMSVWKELKCISNKTWLTSTIHSPLESIGIVCKVGRNQ